MDDKKILGFVPKDQIDKSKYKEDLLDTIDSYRKMIEDDLIEEFIISSKETSGEVTITACCKNTITGVGLLEFAKNILIMYWL